MLYTVTIAYAKIVNNTVQVQAASAAEACERALDTRQRKDVTGWEESGENTDTFVQHVAEGDVENPDGAATEVRVPAEFSASAAVR